MKNSVLTSIICSFALFLMHNGVAFAQSGEYNRCARYAKYPQMRLRSSYGKLKYNTEYSTEKLSELAARSKISEQGMFATGLSHVYVEWKVSRHTNIKNCENYTCVVPTSVDIFFGYRDPVIYLSKDLEPETCKYEVVLRHEQQHQQINKATLDYYLPILQNNFYKALEKLKPQEVLEGQTAQDVVNQLNQTYTDIISQYVKRFQITLQIEQQRLDNLKNYQYEEKLCRKH